jgi:DNA-binding NtrC family response regulator
MDRFFNVDYRFATYLFQQEYVKEQLIRHKGNVTKTAETIGMERSSLYRKIIKLRLKDFANSRPKVSQQVVQRIAP